MDRAGSKGGRPAGSSDVVLEGSGMCWALGAEGKLS